MSEGARLCCLDNVARWQQLVAMELTTQRERAIGTRDLTAWQFEVWCTHGTEIVDW